MKCLFSFGVEIQHTVKYMTINHAKKRKKGEWYKNEYFTGDTLQTNKQTIQ